MGTHFSENPVVR